jgi:hypothetical protein
LRGHVNRERHAYDYKVGPAERGVDEARLLRRQCLAGDTKFMDALIAAGYMAPVEVPVEIPPQVKPRVEPQNLVITKLEQKIKELENALDGKDPGRVWVKHVIRLVCKHYNISRADILSSRRSQGIVRPRQVAFYLCKELTGRSLPEIGRKFGDKDHTTVLHGVRKIEQLIANDPEFASEVAFLRNKLLNAAAPTK